MSSEEKKARKWNFPISHLNSTTIFLSRNQAYHIEKASSRILNWICKNRFNGLKALTIIFNYVINFQSNKIESNRSHFHI